MARSLNLTERPFWTRRVTLVPVKRVRRAEEFVGGHSDGQQPVATCGSTEGEEERDDLGE